MHMFQRVDSPLAAILDRAGKLSARYPRDGDRIEHGYIYVAPPDYHLIQHPGRIELQLGRERTCNDRASMSCSDRRWLPTKLEPARVELHTLRSPCNRSTI
jgi:chemotaxis response regulator CheB